MRIPKGTKTLRVKLDGIESPMVDMTLLVLAVKDAGFTEEPKPEHKFDDRRLFRFDLAWPRMMVAFEREGGKFVKVPCQKCHHEQTRFVSRHHDRKGLEDDAEKYNAAAILGWKVIRATPPMIKDGRALRQLLMAMEATR